MYIPYKYSNIPIIDRFGAGSFTYSLVLENYDGIYKYEVFADNLDNALYIIGCTIGNVLSYTYIDNDVIALVIQGIEAGTYYLYQS